MTSDYQLRLQLQLEREFGVPHDHPKAERLFDLAWEEGHAGGSSDVRHYYREFAELLDLPAATAGPRRYAVARWGHAGESDEHWSLWPEGSDEWDPEIQRAEHIRAAAILNALGNLSDADAFKFARKIDRAIRAERPKVQEILT